MADLFHNSLSIVCNLRVPQSRMKWLCIFTVAYAPVVASYFEEREPRERKRYLEKKPLEDCRGKVIKSRYRFISGRKSEKLSLPNCVVLRNLQPHSSFHFSFTSPQIIPILCFKYKSSMFKPSHTCSLLAL